ncbi:MAG: hypothetical protein D6751_05485 [Deltaproteobacteria bacterium]|nr:MAG: hypothetical protein D6751_05485 [Deltaproteobacteria bacterium]
MIILKLRKLDETQDSTLSALYSPDNQFLGFVIEDGPRPVKVPGKTRIPAGTYSVWPRKHGGFYEKYRKEFGHEFAIELQDVPGFSDILIHIGNTVEDTRGCLLINSGCVFNYRQKVWEGRSSKPAYLRLYDYLEPVIYGYEIFLDIQR